MTAPDGRPFKKPLFQTLLMFGAEAACLLVFLVQFCIKRCRAACRKVGYDRLAQKEEPEATETTTLSMIGLLALPAISDMIASVLLKVGLLLVTSSVYQLMCCLRIIFVAINKKVPPSLSLVYPSLSLVYPSL